VKGIESVIRMFRKQVFQAFFDWLEKNRNVIGKWYDDLYKKAVDAEGNCDTAIKIMGDSLWMFNMIANLGVLAGIGPNQVQLHDIAPTLDKPSTIRILNLIAACLSLQGLPKEISTKPILIVSSKKFSLQLWAQGVR
jgi:hypothetical protein